MAIVLARDDQADRPVDTHRWVNLAASVLEHEGVPEQAELSMAFVGERAMAELNRCYAGWDEPTDVLAFPMDPMDDGPSHEPKDGPPILVGDLVICPAVAARNAPAHGSTYEDELALLVVHGVLHLLGMDHAEVADARDMQRRERELLARLDRPAQAGR